MAASPRSSWNVSVDGDTLTLALAGHLDEAAASLYLEIVRMEVAAPQRTQIILDLAQVDTMDHSGIDLLHSVRTAVKGAGAAFDLKIPRGGVEADAAAA